MSRFDIEKSLSMVAVAQFYLKMQLLPPKQAPHYILFELLHEEIILTSKISIQQMSHFLTQPHGHLPSARTLRNCRKKFKAFLKQSE